MTTWHRWLQAIASGVLGSEPGLRRRVLRLIRLGPLYGTCVLVTLYANTLHLYAPFKGYFVAGYLAVGYVGFYAALRSGWSERYSDPDLALVRALFATIGLVVAYAWGGEARADALMLFALILVLGIFRLAPRQLMLVGYSAVAMLGLVVAYNTTVHPELYPLRYELIQYGVVACCLPSTAIVARQVNLLRDKLTRQKLELRDALERVQHLAQRDALTGIVNRRHMQDMLAHELARQARGHASPCCLALLDLDHFKRINDGHGHAVGDQVLQGFVHTVEPLLRAGDVLARWGGEEFLVLLPCTALDQAGHALERVREQLAQAEVAHDLPSLRITASIGVAERQPGETLDALLERTDRALYAAKSAGRNRVARAGAAHTDGACAHVDA